MFEILHHGAVTGVTGSCHQLKLSHDCSVLIDCGLFQGAEIADAISADNNPMLINFPLDGIQALVVSHCHIDHVGRIPYLLAAGFQGPIYASEATAHLLPLVIEDAIKVGITREESVINATLKLLEQRLVAVPYKQWFNIEGTEQHQLRAKFHPAGHILGSAYIEFDIDKERVIFSGDLGAPYSPLLPAPKSPYRCDTLVIESTYGDKLHGSRANRRLQLQAIIEKCFENKGAVLIPAFSIGRTQELLYELEEIIHSVSKKGFKGKQSVWEYLDIIVDSPLAAEFTHSYRALKALWDAEAKRKVKAGRHPLSFEQLLTINSHQEHLNTIEYLQKTARPAIVIAASGMCSGGRIVNYLKALLGDQRTDVLFVGYQAAGTPGRDIQTYGPKGGYVNLDGQRIDIKAGVYTLSGYSAHADQKDLLNFVKRMRYKPKQIRIVHGDEEAKQALQKRYQELLPEAEVTIAQAPQVADPARV